MRKKKKSKKKVDAKAAQMPDDNKSLVSWFPGHMLKSMRKVREALKLVNIVLEVRDARAPITTSNMAFTEQFKDKSSLVVLNKTNLATPESVRTWNNWFSKSGLDYCFCNALDKDSLAAIVKQSLKIVNTKLLEANPDASARSKIKMMVIGLPNTGKSTIINKLSGRDASKVADKPGQTKQQLWVKVSKELEILDTPGILPPRIKTQDQALILSSLHAIPESVGDSEDTAVFLIKYFLALDKRMFSKFYDFEDGTDLDDSTTPVMQVLDSVATKRGCILKRGQLDYERASKIIVSDFRKGHFGSVCFELPSD